MQLIAGPTINGANDHQRLSRLRGLVSAVRCSFVAGSMYVMSLHPLAVV